jgi:hypothetical protein
MTIGRHHLGVRISLLVSPDRAHNGVILDSEMDSNHDEALFDQKGQTIVPYSEATKGLFV